MDNEQKKIIQESISDFVDLKLKETEDRINTKIETIESKIDVMLKNVNSALTSEKEYLLFYKESIDEKKAVQNEIKELFIKHNDLLYSLKKEQANKFIIKNFDINSIYEFINNTISEKLDSSARKNEEDLKLTRKLFEKNQELVKQLNSNIKVLTGDSVNLYRDIISISERFLELKETYSFISRQLENIQNLLHEENYKELLSSTDKKADAITTTVLESIEKKLERSFKNIEEKTEEIATNSAKIFFENSFKLYDETIQFKTEKLFAKEREKLAFEVEHLAGLIAEKNFEIFQDKFNKFQMEKIRDSEFYIEEIVEHVVQRIEQKKQEKR